MSQKIILIKMRVIENSIWELNYSVSHCSLHMCMMERHIQEIKTWKFFSAAWHFSQTAQELLVQLGLTVDHDITVFGLQSVLFCSLFLNFAWFFKVIFELSCKREL